MENADLELACDDIRVMCSVAFQALENRDEERVHAALCLIERTAEEMLRRGRAPRESLSLTGSSLTGDSRVPQEQKKAPPDHRTGLSEGA